MFFHNGTGFDSGAPTCRYESTRVTELFCKVSGVSCRLGQGQGHVDREEVKDEDKGTWSRADTWTETGNVDGKNKDNPKAWCTRARSRDTRQERGQDVNVDVDKERAREESLKGKQGTKEGDTKGQGHKGQWQ